MQAPLKSETLHQESKPLDQIVDAYFTELLPHPVPSILLAVADDQLRERLVTQTMELGYGISSFVPTDPNLVRGNYELQRQVKFQPDLILIAVPQPQEYCSWLRNSAAYQQIPILVLTADFSEDWINQLLAAGATDCIALNLPAKLLQKRLLPYLGRSQDLNKIYAINSQLQAQVDTQKEILKEALGQVRRAIAKEIEINAARFNSLKNISHELRTSLSIVSLSAQLLQGKEARKDPNLQQELSQQISRAVKAIARIVDNLISVQKVTTKTLEFHPTPTPLVSFCQALVNQWQQDARNQYQIIFNSYGETHPFAEVDPVLVRQILDELAINAMRFSPLGSQIQFNLIWQADRVLFQVIDHGIGIPEAEKSQIFQPFYRGKNADEIAGTPGVGLGLAIAQYATQLHQGTMTLDSQVNQGTTVTVSLPLSQSLLSHPFM